MPTSTKVHVKENNWMECFAWTDFYWNPLFILVYLLNDFCSWQKTLLYTSQSCFLILTTCNFLSFFSSSRLPSFCPSPFVAHLRFIYLFLLFHFSLDWRSFCHAAFRMDGPNGSPNHPKTLDACIFLFFFCVQQPKSDLGRLFVEVSRSYAIRHTHIQNR